jgi:hypothetical protein
MTSRGRAFAGVASTVALLTLLGGPVTATAATLNVSFGAARATPTYGEGIAFTQDVDLASVPRRVELEVTFPGGPGAFLIEVPAPSAAGSQELRYEYTVLTDGHILPNTRLSARWVVTFGPPGSPVIETSEPVSILYRDTRFQWRTREGAIVRVHWYEGDDGFGRRALDIGERAVRETAELLGVEERQPIDFFIYADERSFREALGPGTRENVGGQANAEIRTLFALVRPAEIDQAWVGTVIPHELVHLVFDTAANNPYHFPPKWLNEGLAVYLSQGVERADRDALEAAARNGELMPLDALTGNFPTTFDRFSLAYAESASAVDFLVREHGRDALVGLIRSYANGMTDDQAFNQAIGLDVAAFDAAWRAGLGAAEPAAHGPRPAPSGPVPPGWDAPGAVSSAPAASASSPAGSSAPPVIPTGSGQSEDTGALIPLGVLAGALLTLLVLRRVRAGGPPS